MHCYCREAFGRHFIVHLKQLASKKSMINDIYFRCLPYVIKNTMTPEVKMKERVHIGIC